MEAKSNQMEAVVESLEAFGKTTLELTRLQTVKKTAAVVSVIVQYFVLSVFAALFVLSISIGMSLWIGELLGNSWKGFTCVAGFYVLVLALIYIFFREPIRRNVNRLVIVNLLN